MPGLLLQDSGFPLENGTTFPISNAFCLQNSAFCSVLQQDQNGIAGSLPLPSDSSLTSSGLTRCLDASSCISRTLPFKHRCSSTLMRAATAHALSTRSWSPPSIDVNNGDDEVAALQDYETLWSGIVDNGSDVPNISGCNTGIMLGSFFCDLKDVAKRTSFSTEGSPSGSPTSPTVASLSKYFTSSSNEDCLTADYVYASDEFRMFEFKVRRCTRGRSHDWTECPFAHPGEKARRRDPRRFHYSGTSCPDFRKGNCKRGDACEFAHGVFECWLHPARYRTQPCKDGRSCTRRVCFFAHTPEQLRLLPAAAHSPSTSALRINGSCDLHPYSEIYQSASLSGNCFNEDSFDESMAYGVLECTGSFDGSRCLHAGSPRARHSRCTASHTASPTSTLVCIPHSPPSVSPPLSPSSPHSWHGPLSPALPIAATARGLPPHTSLLSSSRTNFPRVQALLASVQSDGSSFTPGIQFSAPSLSLPSFAHANLYKSFSSAPASPCGPPSPSRKSVNDLVMAVQQLDLKGMNQMWLQHSSSPHASAPSPLSRSSNTFSSSENDAWCADVIEEDEYKLQRVESGKALRAEIYGRAIEAETIMDQDESLGWVNDLV